MRYYDRRKEIGKMLVDIVKYIITIVLIGGLMTDKLTIKPMLWGIILSGIFLLIGFFTLPPNKEE